MTTNKPVLVIGNRAYSSWSFRAWLAVRHAGFNVDIVRLPLDTPEFARCIGDWSPTRRVPVLIVDGQTHWESLAIVELMAERFPDARLWPSDAGARAHARSVSAEMHAGFGSLRARLPFNCRASGRHVAGNAALDADIARIKTVWSECLARRLPGGSWLFGHFTGADAMYAPVALRFHTYGIALPDDLAGYVETVREDPAVREWIAQAKTEPEVIEGEEVG